MVHLKEEIIMGDIETADMAAENAGGAVAQPDEDKKYVVRHNKEDVELTLPELIENAQKGLDYDRIRPSHDLIKKLAAKSGEGDVSRFIAKMENESGGFAKTAPDSQPCDGAAEKNDETEMVAREYPEFVRNGEIVLPEDAEKLKDSGMSIIDACRAADLKRTKNLCGELSARLDALSANAENNAASIGSLSAGESGGKNYFTSREWDRLPKKEKDKFIRSGKIYEFMKKWSGK